MKDKNTKNQWNKKEKAVSIMVVIIMMLTAILLLGGFYIRGKEKKNASHTAEQKVYRSHYMLITENPADEFWKAVYKGAKERGEEEGVYIENLGVSTDNTFQVEELLQIAAAAKVDGIILQADGSEKLDELIDKASEENIPVITVYEDAPQSKRKSFVGIDERQLGEVYGSQILKLKKAGETLRVTVLSDEADEDSDLDLVYSEIKDAVSKEDIALEAMTINRSDLFSSEETIRNLVIDHKSMPDVLVCLNEADTMSAIQAAVDYNVVGKLQMIGFYSTENILDGIEKGILSSSITVDAGQIGAKAVEALLEYRKKVHISEYKTVEPQVITNENRKQYEKDGK